MEEIYEFRRHKWFIYINWKIGFPFHLISYMIFLFSHSLFPLENSVTYPRYPNEGKLIILYSVYLFTLT